MEASEEFAMIAPMWSKDSPDISETLPQLGAAVSRGTIAMLGVIMSKNRHSLSLPAMITTLSKSVRLDNACWMHIKDSKCLT